mgnify:CR=1 FL=1
MPKVKIPPPYEAREKAPFELSELSPLQLQGQLGNLHHRLMYDKDYVDESRRQLMIDIEIELKNREISILSDTVQVEKI